MLGMNQEPVGCSSGCESGWTMYLENSLRVPPPPYEIQDANDVLDDGGVAEEDGECEEEDLSMVSDASSGPPHFRSDHLSTQNGHGSEENDPAAANGLFHSSSKRRRVHDSEHNPSFSDDTASSHLVTKDVVSPGSSQRVENFLNLSQSFSTTSFKKQPAFQEGFGLLKNQTPRKPISTEGSTERSWS